jgi:SAM-dependent methyltransferase
MTLALRRECVLCGSDRLEAVLRFGPQPVAGYLEASADAAIRAPRYDLQLALCRACMLLQQQNEAANALLAERVYAEYQPTYSMSTQVFEYMESLLDRAASMANLHASDAVLEIGSNDGQVLDLFRQRDFCAFGFEPAANLVAASRERNLNVVHAFFDEQRAREFASEYSRVKLVLTRHTLEHAFEPGAFLRAVATVLVDDGLAVIEVPHAHTQLTHGHFEGLTFQHQSVFSLASLCYGLRQAGLNAVDAQLTTMDGGSMVVYARRSGRCTAVPSPGVQALLALEAAADLGAPGGFVRYQTRFAELGSSVHAVLDSVNQSGGVALGYGAGSKGQALINMLGLNAKHLRKIVDDTRGSAGRYIPGAAIEIIRSDDGLAQTATVILVTAPTHAQEILRKERGRLTRATQFLLTSPSLHLAPLG